MICQHCKSLYSPKTNEYIIGKTPLGIPWVLAPESDHKKYGFS